MRVAHWHGTRVKHALDRARFNSNTLGHMLAPQAPSKLFKMALLRFTKICWRDGFVELFLGHPDRE